MIRLIKGLTKSIKKKRHRKNVYFHSVLNSALDGGKWSTLLSCRFTPGYKPVTHLTGGWGGPRASLDEFRKEKIFSDGD
jgi:hypothetical protein